MDESGEDKDQQENKGTHRQPHHTPDTQHCSTHRLINQHAHPSLALDGADKPMLADLAEASGGGPHAHLVHALLAPVLHLVIGEHDLLHLARQLLMDGRGGYGRAFLRGARGLHRRALGGALGGLVGDMVVDHAFGARLCAAPCAAAVHRVALGCGAAARCRAGGRRCAWVDGRRGVVLWAEARVDDLVLGLVVA
jgi:hypothetical protein